MKNFISIRIGNPVTCEVPILIADQPADLSALEKENLKIWLKEPLRNLIIHINPEEITVDENRLIFTISADNQYIGDFRLFVQYIPTAPGILGRFEHDVRAIRFVQYSEDVPGVVSDIDIEVRTIRIELAFNVGISTGGGGGTSDHRELTEEFRRVESSTPRRGRNHPRVLNSTHKYKHFIKHLLHYYGGKQTMLKHILPLISRHILYTDAFAVANAKDAFTEEICKRLENVTV